MAKGRAASNGKAHAKAPPKKVVSSRKGAPKKAPPPQNNSKNKGSRKRVADDASSDSTGEEPDPRPQKKHRGKQKEISDEEEEDEPNDEVVEVMQVDEAGPESDSEVRIFKVTVNKVNCDLRIDRGGWAPYPTPDIHHIGGPYPEGQGKGPSTNFF